MRGGGLLELREGDECVLMDGVRLGLDRAGLELERLALKLLPPELRPALEERPPDDRPPPVAALPIVRHLLLSIFTSLRNVIYMLCALHEKYQKQAKK